MLASPSLCEGRAILTPNNSIKSSYERVVISREQRCKTRCPCRDGGVNEIDPGFARLHRSKRDSHIDPPTCSNAIMLRAQPLLRREQRTRQAHHGELDIQSPS